MTTAATTYTVVVPGPHVMPALCGPRDVFLRQIEQAFPQVAIVVRGNEVHLDGADAPARERWTQHWIESGFRAFEEILAADDARGAFCHGDAPGLADACLIPQVYNAHRFGVDMAPYPTIARINEQCLSLAAFDAARPEKQPDAA